MSRTTEPVTFKTWKGGVLLSIFVGLLAGCHPRAPIYIAEPLPLEKAVRLMTRDLLQQVTVNHKVDNAEIIMDAMIEAETGEVTKTTHLIQQYIIAESRLFPLLKVSELTENTAKSAKYVLSGVTHLEEYGSNTHRITQLSTSIIDLATGQAVAHSEALIDDKKIESEPTLLYRNSPMYIKDKRVQSLIESAQARVGSVVDKEYTNTLITSALLSEAENIFNKGDYQQAVELFSKIAERDDGKVMKTYSGIYESNMGLGHKDLAEEAFSDLVDIGIQNRNLSMKFLFESGRTEFINDSGVRTEYPIWLRQLAKHISAADVCMQIIGHASKSGTQEYNDKLSTERAKAIQKLINQNNKTGRSSKNKAQESLNKTKAIGRGVTECKKCTGDEAVDGYDRRVEFKVVQCSEI